MLMVAGIAEMNPTSLLDFETRTPQSQSCTQPGGRSALAETRETVRTARHPTGCKTQNDRVKRMLNLYGIISVEFISMIEEREEIISLPWGLEIIRDMDSALDPFNYQEFPFTQTRGT